jgi:DNA-binding GntR family transcriptional regulator
MLASSIDVVFADGIPFKSKAPRYRETIYAAVKEAILSGQLIPNQPLVEEQLAATLNVSRTPVREALALLEHEGFIGPRNGRGLYVRAVTHTEFMEMFIANEAVEPYLARRAAFLATPKQLAAIDEAINLAKDSLLHLDTAGFLRASREFHRLVGHAAGNRPLAEFVVQNEERTDMYLINYGKVIQQETMAASLNEHRSILNALQSRDPEAAERLVIYHAQSLRERFTLLFSEELLSEEVLTDEVIDESSEEVEGEVSL